MAREPSPQQLPSRARALRWWFCVGVWFGLGPVPCQAQQFALPLDAAQGLVFGSAQPRTPYRFDAKLAPSLDLDLVRLSALVDAAYENPRWDLGLGGQAGVFVPFRLRDLGLRVVFEGAYLLRTRAFRGQIGFIGEAFGLLRIGVWPGYDLGAHRAELTVSLGVDLVSWWLVLMRDGATRH